MLRHDMVETVGKEFLTSNIEAGEYSYKLVAKTHRFACGMKATYFLLGFYIE